jgi:hypothetical protein
MGLFNFFKRKNGVENGQKSISTAHETNELTPDETKALANSGENGAPDANAIGINLLFQFLERNHEGKGYDDALINSDNINLIQNTDALKNELERTIRRVKTFYEDFVKEIDFHIASRGRSGMVDTVEELSMKKQIAESHIKKVLEIEDDLRNNKGDSQGIIMSYTRGFKNGLAAISHHSILKRKL